MKLFGWGKSKVPQPQTVLQQVKKTDPRSSSTHGLDRGMPMGHTMPCKSSGICNSTRKQQGLFDDEYAIRTLKSSSINHTTAGGGCDESKLQDTIRFVFSNEQQGLLAIGTFALEQLAAIRDTIDNTHWKVAAADTIDRRVVTDPVYEFMMQQSSDDEAYQPRTPNKTAFCEFPVSQESAPSKALTVYKKKPGDRSPVAGTKPIVLLTALPPELRRSLDSAFLPKSYVPLGHWTDSVPPPVELPEQEYYSSYFCGLFKRPSSRSNAKRLNTTHQNELVQTTVEVVSEHKTKPEKSTGSMLSSAGVPSLTKLAKLWKSSCKQSSARIAPERPSPPQMPKATGEVLTTPVSPPLQSSVRPPDECSPKVAEFRRRVAMHERNMAIAQEELTRQRQHCAAEAAKAAEATQSDGGHWIKTDSEYFVLEM